MQGGSQWEGRGEGQSERGGVIEKREREKKNKSKRKDRESQGGYDANVGGQPMGGKGGGW